MTYDVNVKKRIRMTYYIIYKNVSININNKFYSWSSANFVISGQHINGILIFISSMFQKLSSIKLSLLTV